MEHKQVLLGIFAHPDDESFGPGATLARYAAEGGEVHVVIATDGIAGSVEESTQLAEHESLAQVRSTELSRAAVALVTQTINDLYFVVNVRTVDVPLLSLLKGLVIGLAAALLAAAGPALEATSVPPVSAFRRSVIESKIRRSLPWLTLTGLGLATVSVPVSYTHLRAHEAPEHLVCRLLLENTKATAQ